MLILEDLKTIKHVHKAEEAFKELPKYIYDSLEACIVVTTMDLDRYKNNRNTVNGKDMHPSEVYSGSARDLEENIIVYACGHELIID